VSATPEDLGYDHIEEVDSTTVSDVAPATVRVLAGRARSDKPFFLSVGFFETHREYFEPSSVAEAVYSRPPDNIIDTAATRRDIASFKASARSFDRGVGAVLEALDDHRLAERTLVVLTTDHGLAFPGPKATMFDRGIGVLLIMRGPGGFGTGTVVDALVSHLDVYPTLCELAGVECPPWLEGTSLLPLVRGETEEIRAEVFAELTYHAAYEPQRAVRTKRYKYTRRFDRTHPGLVLANVDDGPSKDALVAAGWGDVSPALEALYDLWLDPGEGHNRIDDPALAEVREDLRDRLTEWMERTEDPLRHGPVPPAAGTVSNSVDQVSPSESTIPSTARSATLTRRARQA
jgi:N-sulfoglucosamine sulfohydrolase